ncbi:methyltransferase [Enterovibrio sp. ZSDZ35]|uniref:Ribosomal RNA large subunit methyltransferase G n=1 Tax=Enterovibrio qingdaonensis TaxID=2899818 RepID=A0ABT5QR44_9GAMM|nr:methyltransferase [Enterovibrio sp. ZSDZ35]MDD1783459.1 methyltransferase [Enterovibrio sp. ZSDZ35]
MKTTLEIAGISLSLRRYPLQNNESLQAWDAADEYLIDHLESMDLAENSHLLVLNDSFGAITCWASQKGVRVTTVNDSLLSQQSVEQNLTENALASEKVNLLSSVDTLPSDITLAVMKLPKNNRLLVWQLQQLSHLTNDSLVLVSGAKAKDIHTSTLKLFEKYLGTTTTSLAKKKSRLIFTQKEKHIERLPAATTSFEVPEYKLSLENHANVFSSESLDIAAYLMLEHIPQSEDIKNIIDLGCGNGVLSIQAARLNPQATITAVDESFMAVASAKLNLEKHGIDESRIHCLANNCLDGFEKNTADLVLCNPPFHQLHAVTDHIAWQMFCDARRVLEPNGRIVVIGNRHLGYHAKLKRLFGNAQVIASNQKFVIVEAQK